MVLIKIDPNPSRTNLVIFGLFWLAVLGGWGALMLYHAHRTAGIVLESAAILLPLIGFWSFDSCVWSTSRRRASRFRSAWSSRSCC